MTNKPKNPLKDKRLVIRLPGSLRRELAAAADEDGRKLADMARHILIRWVSQRLALQAAAVGDNR